MVWPRVLGHSDQGARLNHSVLCVEWLVEKPRGDERPHPYMFSGCWRVQQDQEARLRRHIWTNLLTRITFVFLAKLFEFGTYFPI